MGKMRLIKLVYPVDFGGESITEITLNRPKGKHLRRLPAEPETGDLLDLAGALLTGDQSHAIIDELDAVDVLNVIEVVSGFFENGPAIGGDS